MHIARDTALSTTFSLDYFE